MRRPASTVAALSLILAAGCGTGKRLQRIEDQQKETLRQVEELKTAISGLDKRLTVRQTMAQSGGSSAAGGDANGVESVSVEDLLKDPLAFSGRMVQLRAVLAAPVDKDRAFLVVLSKPKDVMNNVGVYYDADDIATKRDVYLSDPGEWLAIEGQLSVDRESNGYKTYSGYALKAKSVKKAR